MTLMEQLSAYIPYNEQEARDRALLLECLRREPDVMTRQNPLAHFTASAWIVNPTRTRVLMVYHNIYHSWSWLGGHADGESDLLAVALREAREESGIRSARPISEDIFSLEVLTVDVPSERTSDKREVEIHEETNCGNAGGCGAVHGCDGRAGGVWPRLCGRGRRRRMRQRGRGLRAVRHGLRLCGRGRRRRVRQRGRGMRAVRHLSLIHI